MIIYTPTADAIDRDLAGDDDDDLSFLDPIQYTDALPTGYDFGDYIPLPRNPVSAAAVLREQFSGAELAVLVQELVRL